MKSQDTIVVRLASFVDLLRSTDKTSAQYGELKARIDELQFILDWYKTK
jgi:hypothetical protein